MNVNFHINIHNMKRCINNMNKIDRLSIIIAVIILTATSIEADF